MQYFIATFKNIENTQLTQKITAGYGVWPLAESVPFQQSHYQPELKQK